MLQRRGVIGLIFGIVALALGVAAWAGAGNDGILALFAGLLGLGAGAAALISEFQTDKTSGLVAAAERQSQEATAQLQRTEDAISHERKMRTKAEDNAARLQALPAPSSRTTRRSTRWRGACSPRSSRRSPLRRPTRQSTLPRPPKVRSGRSPTRSQTCSARRTSESRSIPGSRRHADTSARWPSACSTWSKGYKTKRRTRPIR